MQVRNQDYLSLHIYYNANDLRPVLLGCVDPLIARLERQDLLSRYFFIRYWEGGSHIRLRLLPKSEEQAQEVKAITESAVREFLDERPSFFDADVETLRPLMRRLFEYEYGPEEFVKRFGEDGQIPIAENNTFAYQPYAPEYDRYGGVNGIELSERHFHVSSRIALEALRDSNSHLRSSILGLALQLMVHFGFAALGDKDEVVDFFRSYVARWQGLSVPPEMVQGFERLYEQQAPKIRAHFSQIGRLHESLEGTESSTLGKWLRHAFWLRDHVAEYFADGRLQLRPAPESAKDAMRRLMISYIHMMNNRLGVLILEEVYLARTIVRALGGEA